MIRWNELHTVRLAADATAFGCRAADSFGRLSTVSFGRSPTSIGCIGPSSDTVVVLTRRGLAPLIDFSGTYLHEYANARTCSNDANIWAGVGTVLVLSRTWLARPFAVTVPGRPALVPLVWLEV